MFKMNALSIGGCRSGGSKLEVESLTLFGFPHQGIKSGNRDRGDASVETRFAGPYLLRLGMILGREHFTSLLPKSRLSCLPPMQLKDITPDIQTETKFYIS